MLSAEPERGYDNPAFRFKMYCLAPALLTHFTIHRRVTRLSPASATTAGGRPAACLSLALWSGVILGGRALAFFLMLLSFCQWIETNSLSIAIREGALYYPILGALHLLGIAWFGGMVLMAGLSVLGLGLPHAPVAEVRSQFRRWKWSGVWVMLLSGGLLWWAEPEICYKSISFGIELALLALVGLNALLFRKGSPVTSRAARFGACVSLLLWIALVFAGRGSAFL